MYSVWCIMKNESIHSGQSVDRLCQLGNSHLIMIANAIKIYWHGCDWQFQSCSFTQCNGATPNPVCINAYIDTKNWSSGYFCTISAEFIKPTQFIKWSLNIECHNSEQMRIYNEIENKRKILRGDQSYHVTVTYSNFVYYLTPTNKWVRQTYNIRHPFALIPIGLCLRAQAAHHRTKCSQN